MPFSQKIVSRKGFYTIINISCRRVRKKRSNLKKNQINICLIFYFFPREVYYLTSSSRTRLSLLGSRSIIRNICLTLISYRAPIILFLDVAVNFLLLFIHSQFTDDPTVAICSDSGGSVFVLSFK